MKLTIAACLLTSIIPWPIKHIGNYEHKVKLESEEQIYMNCYDSVYYLSSNVGDVGSCVHLGNGYLLTAKHVVTSNINLIFTTPVWRIHNSEGKSFNAVIVSKSEKHDLALLFCDKIKKEPFVFVEDSVYRKFGENLIAVGAVQFNKRIIKVYNNKPNYKDPQFLNISGPIYHGNSGGGVFTYEGKLVGIIMGIGVHPMRYRMHDSALATGIAAIKEFFIEIKE